MKIIFESEEEKKMFAWTLGRAGGPYTCPSYYGLEETHCTSTSDCSDCWKRALDKMEREAN